MEDCAKNVEGLVDYLITNIVDDKDSAKLETVVEDNAITVNVRVNPEDAGHVIGREGNVIKSIRTLARACVGKRDIKVDVELVEDE